MSKKKNDLIVQSNDLVEAYYDTDLTVNEHKLIRYVASKIKIQDNDFPDYSFSVQEFADAIGLKGNGLHARIEKIADEITKKRIKIKSKDSDKIGWFPWFSAVVYEKGIVDVSFNPLIKNFLLSLEDNFTKYSFAYISPLRSGFSIRLFELLKQYEKIGTRTIELEELKQMLGVQGKYPSFNNFKQKVLKKAQEELKEKTLLSFEIEEIRRSRKVVSVKFIIDSKYKTKQISFFDEEPVDNDVTSIQSLFKEEALSLKNQAIEKWLTDYGKELILLAYDEVKNRKTKTKINNPEKYIEAILISLNNKPALEKTDANSPKLQQVIDSIILSFKNSSELIPDFIIQERALEEFMERLDVTDTEARQIWNEHREHICKSTKKLIKEKKRITRT
ncbi:MULTISPECIES: replication initiation protein [Metabacillus]|uniref:replication initiation protein n=1 Tax=Metabacillus TaxID=2675233 RepID=UPI000C803040|nr:MULTISPECIES: replication initiation protein [Metabacillus]MCM3443584.1 replication initiation protein [Metabacillus halosaccharovorans]PMC34255.1 hypothetical protein CJ195_24370 [Bacillus sp. UMB0899]